MSKSKALIRGTGGGGGKDGGGAGRAPIESPDTLRSIQYAHVLDLISEGEIEGLVDGLRSVYLDDTPIQNANGTYNFKDVVMESRTGTQAQDYVPGFNAAEAETSVGAEVTQAAPVTRTISNVNNTSVRVTISIPQLSLQNTETGDLGGTSVELAIDVQNNGGGFVPQPLRKIFSSGGFAVGAVSRNTVASTRINVTVSWTGQSSQAPQTLTCKLQYRAYGDSTWLDYATHTFQSTYQTSNVAIGWNGLNQTLVANGTKTFNLTLAEDEYEFRVVKITGSLQQAAIFGFSQPPLTGINYGGTVSISYGEAYVPAYTDVISGKTMTNYQRSYRIALPAGGPWDIRVRRITADSAQTILQNKTFFSSYTEIVDALLNYPNSALIGLQINAKQFNNIPQRGYEIRGIKVRIPDNYDPLTREYTGTWSGSFTTAWSDNPAWVFFDLMTNDRYGLGEFISDSQIDKWALYTIAQYCDEMVEDGFGGLEPRFTCNLYLQTREEAYRVIDNIASIFRGMVYWAAGQIHVTQDAPTDAVQQYTPANVIGGMFNYSGSSGKVRHTVALIAWNDPQDGYRQKVEYYEDKDAIARYGVVQTEIVAIGCTSRGQAHRLGKWLVYSEQYETETVTFKAAMDSVFNAPGDIIKTQDPVRAGARMGGRLVSATVSSVVIDSPVTIGAGTYTITCMLPDGTIEDRTVTNSPGSTSTITVSPDFTEAPQAFSIWTMASDALIPEEWRIVSISESGPMELEITALSYRSDKYDAVEQGLVLEPLPLSLVTTLQPAMPTNLIVVESLYLSALGVVGVNATVSWTASQGAANYTLVYQLEGQNPVVINNIQGTTVEIKPLLEGNYTFTLYATNTIGRRSQENILEQIIYGKTTPPADVSNLQLAPLGTLGLFTWSQSTDLDVIVGGRVLFRYSPDTAATWENAFPLPNTAAGSATAITLPLQAGIYLAKFEDSSGNPSESAVSVITNAANVLALNFVESLTGHPGWTGTKMNTQYYADLSGLLLISADDWDSTELMDSDELMDFGGGVTATAGSYALGQIDLGTVQISRVSAAFTSRGIDLLDTWDSDELMDSSQLVDGDVVTDVSASIYMRYTSDDPAGTPTWSAWEVATLADISARAYEAELRMSSQSDYHNVLVTEATFAVDMPDRVVAGNDITSGTSSYTVTYSPAFMVAPALGITAQDMETGDYYEITTKSETGFTIQFFNASGIAISRTFDYIAKGY